jgi:hypothetical protein
MMRLESVHYNALRVSFFGFHNKVPHQILDHDYMRATPKEWMNYCVSCEFIHIYTCQSPQSLFQRLDDQSYQLKRQQLVKFYYNSHQKIGLQVFSNKVPIVSGQLNFDWYYSRLSLDSLKLKQSLFKYPSVACSYVPVELQHQIYKYRKLRKANLQGSPMTTLKAQSKPQYRGQSTSAFCISLDCTSVLKNQIN